MNLAMMRTPTPTKKQTDWNELFTADVIAHKRRVLEGGLGQWEYSTPDHEHDPVRGSELWGEFLAKSPEYYILKAENAIIEKAEHKITDIIPEPVTLGFLGIGNATTFTNKDLKLTSRFKNVVGATVFDISQTYLNQSIGPLDQHREEVGIKSTVRQDIFSNTGISISKPVNSKAKRIATLFGLTLSNVSVSRDVDGKLQIPEEQIRTRLRTIRSSLETGDFFIHTYDANDDPEKIENAYAGQAEFACNLAHRINRDTPYDVDPDTTKFRVKYDPQSHLLCHFLTLEFQKNGGPQELLINVSPKIPTALYEKWCKAEGWAIKEKFSENGIHMPILEAIQ